MDLLSDEEARATLGYVYRNTDDSALYPLLRPGMARLARLLPAALSPNLVTCAGLACSLLNAALLCGVSPLLGPLAVDPAAPAWLFVVSAALVLGYFVCDAVDGQQGRRTGQYCAAWACPSTELFDHGCDAANSLLLAVSGAALFGLSSAPWAGPAFLAGALSVFQFATWETTYAGAMRFPAGPANPTEGLFGVVGLLLLTAALGPAAWTAPLLRLAGRPWTAGELVAGCSVALAAVSAAAAVRHVRARYAEGAPHCHPGGFAAARAALLPWTAWALLLLLWPLAGAVWGTHPKLCMLLAGGQFLVAVLHLIAAEVSRAPLRLGRCVLLQAPGWAPLAALLLAGPAAEHAALVPALAVQAAAVAACWRGLLDPLCRALQMPHFWSIPPKARAMLLQAE